MRKLSAIISGVGNAEDGYKGAKLYYQYQHRTAQIIKQSADLVKHEQRIIKMAEELGGKGLRNADDAISFLTRLKTNSKMTGTKIDEFNFLMNKRKQADHSIRKSTALNKAMKVDTEELKNNKDAMKVFTQLSKGETPGALSNWITKVSNNSKLISKSVRYTENVMLGALGLSIGKSLYDNYYSPEDAQGTVANFADITSTAVVEGGGMALDSAAFLLLDSGRGFSRQTWYNKVDMIAMKQALNKRAFAKLAALSDAEIAMLYFDQNRLKDWFRRHLKSSPISLRAFEDFVRAKGITIEKLSQLYRNQIKTKTK